MYFDGELPEAEQADALAHVETCEQCQRVLATAVSLDAAMSERQHEKAKPVDELAARKDRQRWSRVAIAAGVIAMAAAVLLWILRPSPPAPRVAIELPKERAAAMRFTGDAFAKHRPYSVARGDSAHESISLATLAELQKRGELHNLVAALTSSGDLARARELAAMLPDDAPSESDRAAIALAGREREVALGHLYRALAKDRELTAAWWNLALVARDLGLPRVAKDAFEHVIAKQEPGWSAEARNELVDVEREIAAEDSPEIENRAREMLRGGSPLDAQDVQRAPTIARMYFYDALRVATTKAEVERLRPLAAALDAAAGLTTASAALERTTGANFAVRAKVATKYRALALRELNAADQASLVAELHALGPAVADIYVGAVVLLAQTAKHFDELRTIAKPWSDPWFDVLLERARIEVAYPNGDLRAEPELVAAIAKCNPAVALRCGQLTLALGTLLIATGRIEEGEARTQEAVDAFRRARAYRFFRNARTFLAEIHRRRGRFALAHAEFDEEIFAAKQAGECDLARYSEIGRANVAFMAREVEDARVLLPSPKPPEGCSPGVDVIGLIAAVDLARLTEDPRDAAAARGWVDAAKASAPNEPTTTIAAARLLPRDPDALAALREWLDTSKRGYGTDELRTLGYSTLISDAGARGAWDEVIQAAKAEYRMTAEPPCLLVTSVDDDRVTIAAKVGADLIGEATTILAPEPASASPLIVGKLASCTAIAVIGRTQSHGRADLLPATYPWWFVGDSSAAAAVAPTNRALQVIDVRPPDVAGAPRLPALGPSSEQFDVTLAGADATPKRVLAQLGTSSYAEIHAHGIASGSQEDAAFLALSPDENGTFALDAGEIRKAKLTSAPFIVLGACSAAAVASVFRERWSLPDAFLVAGARGVVAADVPIPDASARAVLDELHHRISAGEDPATALAAIRAARGGWAAHLMLFR
jgi:hypothetical protein